MADTEKIMQLAEKGKVKKVLSYANSKDAQERAAAAVALGKFPGDDAFNRLIFLLNDAESAVRVSAAKGLGALGMEKGKEFLRHAISKSDDEAFKEAARHAMGAIPSKQ